MTTTECFKEEASQNQIDKSIYAFGGFLPWTSVGDQRKPWVYEGLNDYVLLTRATTSRILVSEPWGK